MSDRPTASRTALKRHPERGSLEKASVYSILDEGLVCHVGFCVDGQPFVIPFAYGRDGDELFLHGSAGSRALKALAGGAEVCVTVTLLDGLVLARSAFHHSMNYRSAVIFGRAKPLRDAARKETALLAISEHVCRGRWREVRPPAPSELLGTLVLALPLAEASAKVRSGPPIDAPEDHALPVWAGVIPLSLEAGEPAPDPQLKEGIPCPAYTSGYKRGIPGLIDPA